MGFWNYPEAGFGWCRLKEEMTAHSEALRKLGLGPQEV
jgi:hypothetical protein